MGNQPKYDVEEEQEQAPQFQQLTKEGLTPDHRAKAKAKLVQAMTPEAVEGKARPGLWLMEGQQRQYKSLRLITGLPLWGNGEKGSIYTYTAFVISGTDEAGKEHQIGKVATIRMQGSAVQAAQQINAAIFEAPEGQEKVQLSVGARFIKGKMASWYAPEISLEPLSEEELQAAIFSGI